jgi:hypothetical protein
MLQQRAWLYRAGVGYLRLSLGVVLLALLLALLVVVGSLQQRAPINRCVSRLLPSDVGGCGCSHT